MAQTSESADSSSSKSKFAEYFDVLFDGDAYGICKICKLPNKGSVKIKMKNRNTSGLKKHMLSVHKKEYYKLFPSGRKQSTTLENFVSLQSLVSTLKKFLQLKIACSDMNNY